MSQVGVGNSNVGLVKGGPDLAAVDAMADMSIDQTGLLQWLSLCFVISAGNTMSVDFIDLQAPAGQHHRSK
jgi:hypothetical protein